MRVLLLLLCLIFSAKMKADDAIDKKDLVSFGCRHGCKYTPQNLDQLQLCVTQRLVAESKNPTNFFNCLLKANTTACANDDTCSWSVGSANNTGICSPKIVETSVKEVVEGAVQLFEKRKRKFIEDADCFQASDSKVACEGIQDKDIQKCMYCEGPKSEVPTGLCYPKELKIACSWAQGTAQGEQLCSTNTTSATSPPKSITSTMSLPKSTSESSLLKISLSIGFVLIHNF